MVFDFDECFQWKIKMKKFNVLLIFAVVLVLFAGCKDEVSEPVTYTVSFVSDGSVYQSQMILEGRTATEPAMPSKQGYMFDGWYLDIGYTIPYSFSEPINDNTTLYAKWTYVEPIYTVTFESNGGDSIQPQAVKSGNLIVMPENPTKNGFEFTGWFTDTALTVPFDQSTPISSDTILYAGWKQDPISGESLIVTFSSNGGTSVASQAVAYGALVIEPDSPDREGYEFGGWYVDAECTIGFDFSKPVTENTILYAKWNIVNPVFTVRFETNGGTLIAEKQVLVGTLIDEPEVPIKKGYVFTGWYADSSLLTLFSFDKPIDADITLYAGWKHNVVSIAFSSNGGTAIPSQVIEYGSIATEPTAPRRSNYKFAGWFLDQYLTIPYNFDKPVFSDLLLYAKWVADGVWLVDFLLPDGTIYKSDEVLDGAVATEPSLPQIPSGFIFTGWFEANSANQYDFGSAVKADIDLIARYEEVTSLQPVGSTPSECFSFRELSDGTLELVDFVETTGISDIYIPDSVNGKIISRLGDYSLAYTNISSVSTSANVIGNYAFLLSHLKSVELREGVEIIEDDAFSNCRSLSTVEMCGGISTIGEDAFRECTKLRFLEIPESVKSIGNNAFSYCLLLESIEIPEGTMIGDSAFIDCTSLADVKFSSGVNIGDSAFRGCTAITSLEIPEGVELGDRAFSDCTSLVKVKVISNAIIGDYAFSRCSSLVDIELPSKSSKAKVSLGSDAFYSCTSLVSVVLPGSVTQAGDFVFRGCTNLRSVQAPFAYKQRPRGWAEFWYLDAKYVSYLDITIKV